MIIFRYNTLRKLKIIFYDIYKKYCIISYVYVKYVYMYTEFLEL